MKFELKHLFSIRLNTVNPKVRIIKKIEKNKKIYSHPSGLLADFLNGESNGFDFGGGILLISSIFFV